MLALQPIKHTFLSTDSTLKHAACSSTDHNINQHAKDLSMGSQRLRPIFVTGTDTDVGKTYVSARLAKALVGLDPLNTAALAYYKAAISGESSIEQSDAGLVKSYAALAQDSESLCSYLFAEAVSPHLAAQHAQVEISFAKIVQDFSKVYFSHDLTMLEGSGGIYCPIRYDESEVKGQEQDNKVSLRVPHTHGQEHELTLQVDDAYHFTICDLMKALDEALGLNIIIVSKSGLGSINQALTTIKSLQLEGFRKEQMHLVFNYYESDNYLHKDNIAMVERMSGVKVLATMAHNDNAQCFSAEKLRALLQSAK